jgi:UDP:flavonoid glycosyltransferase YjiC (YdhE family)
MGALATAGQARARRGCLMASVLYAWEFGANLGHIGTFLPIARELRAPRQRVHWVVTQPTRRRGCCPAGFDWLQAPTMPEQRAKDRR